MRIFRTTRLGPRIGDFQPTINWPPIELAAAYRAIDIAGPHTGVEDGAPGDLPESRETLDRWKARNYTHCVVVYPASASEGGYFFFLKNNALTRSETSEVFQRKNWMRF